MKKGWIRFFALVLCLSMAMAATTGCTSQPATTEQAATATDEAVAATEEPVAEETTAPVAEEVAPAAENTTKWSIPAEPAGAPPTGIKIALIPSDATLSGCVAPCTAAEEAAKAIGWEVQSYDGGGNPAQQNKMIINAITWGANVIMNVAIEPKSIQQGLKAAKDAGVLMVSCSNGSDDPNPTNVLEEGQLDFAFDVAPNFKSMGQDMASWIINDAGDSGEIVVFGDKEFASCMVVQEGLMEGLNNSNMTVGEVQYFTGNQIGDTLNRMLVAYLTAHPNCKYVYAPFDPSAASMVEGLNQANMKDVKVMGSLGIQQNIEYIRSGNVQVATNAFDNEYMGWATIDQTIRLLNGKELASPHDENLPHLVLDKTNLPEAGSNWGVASMFDFKTDFLNSWK